MCSFNEKHKEEEKDFIEQFFLSLYSGIKKRFPIKTIINRYKILVSKIKTKSIWVSRSKDGSIKMNESFVLTYLLQNADQRLKIELMSLLKENMPIPLYLKPFETIFKVKEQFELNQELLWILKKGYVVTSIGLHTKENLIN
jgi:carboxypeptidase C (cathepsin A)